jgi:hypothetical protein
MTIRAISRQCFVYGQKLDHGNVLLPADLCALQVPLAAVGKNEHRSSQLVAIVGDVFPSHCQLLMYY